MNKMDGKKAAGIDGNNERRLRKESEENLARLVESPKERHISQSRPER